MQLRTGRSDLPHRSTKQAAGAPSHLSPHLQAMYRSADGVLIPRYACLTMVGTESMGSSSFREIKEERNLVSSDSPLDLKKLFVKIKSRSRNCSFDSGFGLCAIRLCDVFTRVRVPPDAFHIIQKRHAVTPFFGPSRREKTPEFRVFFAPASFLASKPGFALQKRYPMKMRTSDPEKIRFYI